MRRGDGPGPEMRSEEGQSPRRGAEISKLLHEDTAFSARKAESRRSVIGGVQKEFELEDGAERPCHSGQLVM